MSNFERAFAALLVNEGGFTVDEGGQTRYGITEAVARANGFTGNMRELPLETAKAIYAKEYWLPICDQLAYGVAFQVFDAAVNSGAGRAIAWLQHACGVNVDGTPGAQTIAAARAANPCELVIRFNWWRWRFMLQDQTGWRQSGKGWSNRIMKNLMEGLAQ